MSANLSGTATTRLVAAAVIAFVVFAAIGIWVSSAPPHALDASWQSLAKVGNLSSASVLLVLQDFMNQRRPAPGTLSILAAMGPGFCSELVLLEW